MILTSEKYEREIKSGKLNIFVLEGGKKSTLCRHCVTNENKISAKTLVIKGLQNRFRIPGGSLGEIQNILTDTSTSKHFVPSHQYLIKHFKITHKTVNWMLESCGFVLFNKKVTNPCSSITR